jgi:hypothetical protein
MSLDGGDPRHIPRGRTARYVSSANEFAKPTKDRPPQFENEGASQISSAVALCGTRLPALTLNADGQVSEANAVLEPPRGARVILVILAQQPNAHGLIRDAEVTAQRL